MGGNPPINNRDVKNGGLHRFTHCLSKTSMRSLAFICLTSR